MAVKRTNPTDAILAVEAARCEAIGRGDLAALDAMLLPNYVHVHSNGRMTDKAGTLDRVAAAPRMARRGTLDIRIRGAVALVVGEQISAGTDGMMRGLVTQTLRYVDGRWRFASFHITVIA